MIGEKKTGRKAESINIQLKLQTEIDLAITCLPFKRNTKEYVEKKFFILNKHTKKGYDIA